MPSPNKRSFSLQVCFKPFKFDISANDIWGDILAALFVLAGLALIWRFNAMTALFVNGLVIKVFSK